jgi:urea transport system permease protein
MLRTLSLVLVLLGTLAFPPARADEFTDAVAALAEGSFRDKANAVEKLGNLGDPRALPALRAMTDGQLHAGPDKRAVIVTPQGPIDAVTGQAVKVAADQLQRVNINNAVRTALRTALSRLQIFDPDPARRMAAAEEMLKSPSPEAVQLLRAAAEKESDGRVRDMMRFGLSFMTLKGGSREERMAALGQLAGSVRPEVTVALRDFLKEVGDDVQLRLAVERALDRSELNRLMLDLALNLFQGISLGSVLLLASIGLAITFGVMGVINMAHGEMLMIGAYTTFVVQELFRAFLPKGMFDLYLVAALPTAFVVAALVGIALERGIIRFLYGRPLETLLATWGLSLMLQQAVRSIFGPTNREVANPSWMTGGVELVGDAVLTYNRICIIIFSALIMVALGLIMRRTSIGLDMRAVTQNRPMAAAMGIPTGRVDAFTFGLGSGIAGMGGVALSQIGNVSPNLGQIYIVDAFMVVVFGGVGNMVGTVVGALSLGMINKFLEPFAGAVLGKILVLVAIILFIQKRPRGLFALKGRAVES